MSVCRNFSHYADFEDKPYCILHYPGKDKKKDFRKEFRKKEFDGSNDYRGIWFPEMANFSHTDFEQSLNFRYVTFADLANFTSAAFSGWIQFQEAVFLDEAGFSGTNFSLSVDFDSTRFCAPANFYDAKFAKGISFTSAVFAGETEFNSAQFTGFANFRAAVFSDSVSFNSAVFSEDAYFHKAVFEEKSQVSFHLASFRKRADFSSAIINGHLHFEAGNNEITDASSNEKIERFTPVFEGDLDLKKARITKPEQISFDKVRLSPDWFVNTDSRKFIFSDVIWEGIDRSDSGAVDSKIEYLEKNHSNPHRLLAIACRQLAVNAEENNRYEEASKFRFLAMESQRLEYSRKITPWRLHWWYWFSSGYGEIWHRAALVLVGIWLLFAGLYFSPLSSFSREAKRAEIQAAAPPAKIESLAFGESLIYSLNVIALQKPEPAPNGLPTRAFVTLETILGPLQAALLALAIRRKFMR